MESMEPIASPPSIPSTVPSADTPADVAASSQDLTAQEPLLDPASTDSHLTDSHLTNPPVPETSPLPTAKTLAEVVQPHLLTYAHHIKKYEEAVLEGFEVEDLHDLRVTWRQLRVILQMLVPVLTAPTPKILKKMQGVTAVIGSIRDTDVLLEQITHLRSQFLSLPEQRVLARATDRLMTQRAKCLRQIRRMLLSDKHSRLKHQLHHGFNPLIDLPIAQQPAIDVIPDLLSPHWAALWLHPGWWIALQGTPAIAPPTMNRPSSSTHLWGQTLSTVDFSTLHDLRKAIKRVRYEVAFFKSHYSSNLSTDLDRLKALQGALGKLQDTVVLMEYFDKTLKPKQKRRSTQLRILLEQQLYTHLQTLQIDRAGCLEMTYRTELRQLLAHPQGAAIVPTSPLPDSTVPGS
ncbi:CHAD domain-containing protein [Alkalinema pantanalense CENA528]|uniref:CHAD domain-containing protein n=1 Tax=Alkalinema pantanalense TaxID=1620705 RepID=UPI003D6E6C7E